ncbi:hypothetical protein OSTOST_14509 [Ostertagia ostertagi]
MVKADGSDCGVYLDVTVMWKLGLSPTTSKKTPSNAETQKAPSKEEKPPEPRPAVPSQISVDNIRSASSSLEDDYSPVSVVSPKIPSVAESIEREGAVSEREERLARAQMKRMEKEKARDEIRSLLGDLPPIAKPRLTKAPSEFSSFPLFRDQAKQGSQRSNSSTESAKSDDTTVERHRSVVFTDPLHRSIPRDMRKVSASEASSASSPPPKPAVRLPVSGGRSAIRTRQEVRQEEDASDSDENRTVSIFIDRIYIPEFSRLLHPSYDNVKVYVDWFFLDYPLEESRTPVAIPLPRIPDSPGLFVYKKEFHLSRRRVALLDQWLELGNRLDFTLVTEGDDSEELAVAQLELSRTATDETTTIQFLDINGEHYADLDLVISYSPQIFDCLRG